MSNDQPTEINENGDRIWLDADGRLHREDGPAVECTNGDKFWYRNGVQHREDGPAAECVNRGKFWFKSGLCHRDDGPAAEWSNGTKEWLQMARFIAKADPQSNTGTVILHGIETD